MDFPGLWASVPPRTSASWAAPWAAASAPPTVTEAAAEAAATGRRGSRPGGRHGGGAMAMGEMGKNHGTTIGKWRNP